MIAAIVDEAHRGGRKVAAHAQNPRAILAAAHAGVSIDHGSLIHHTAAAELRARGIVLMPTLAPLDFAVANAQPAAVEALKRRRDIAFTNAKMAFTSGVRIVLGTKASVLPNRRNARELCALVETARMESRPNTAGLLNSQFECRVPRLVHTCQMKPDKSRRR